MAKQNYDGLKVEFLPIEGTNVIRTSTACSIISVAYYIKTWGQTTCETETYEEGLEVGYSLDWNAEPPDDA